MRIIDWRTGILRLSLLARWRASQQKNKNTPDISMVADQAILGFRRPTIAVCKSAQITDNI